MNIDIIKCPICKSKNVIKKGRKKTKYRIKQAFYCKNCKRYFVDKEMKNKTYSAKVIINAINYYNLGNTLEESSSLVNRRFKVKTSKSSVKRWVSEYSNTCSFKNIRKQVFKDYKKEEIIFTKSFKHQGLEYLFRYHKAKLKLYTICFPGLSKYIERLEENCPSDVFEGGIRCSDISFNVIINISSINSRKNQACHLCRLALFSINNNRKSHEATEEFMLINDAATLACEIPVWFWDKKMNVGISGHIDLIQIRFGKIYVLDFKPEAKYENKQKVASQLYLYARGLSYRTRINLKYFRCAWFDENDYYEFSPSDVKISESSKLY